MIACCCLQLALTLNLHAGAMADALSANAAAPDPPATPAAAAAPQVVRARIATVGGVRQFAALWLDGDGANQIYIMIKQKNSSGMFHQIGFYQGEACCGWPGMTGGAALRELPGSFSSADITVEHDGQGNVKVTLTHLDPPGPDQVHERGGWQPRNGSEFGIAGFTGLAAIDDFSFGSHGVCDDFNRPDGPLGDAWALRAGTVGLIRNGRAFVGINEERARYAYLGSCAGDCVYKIRKSQPRRKCEACPPVRSVFRSGDRCQDVGDCPPKLKTRIDCPEGPGMCKLKGKRRACE